MFGGVTVTGTLFLLFPTLTTILHAPGLLAVTFPFLVTVAIFLLLDVNFAPFCFTLIVVFLPTVKAIFFPDLIVTLALASTGFTAIIVATMATAITIEVICLKIFIFFCPFININIVMGKVTCMTSSLLLYSPVIPVFSIPSINCF